MGRDFFSDAALPQGPASSGKRSRRTFELDAPTAEAGGFRVKPLLKVEKLVMADIVMAYLVMAYLVMAYLVMAYLVMAYIIMAYIVMAYISRSHC